MDSKKAITALKKARSHIDKVIDMVEKDECCLKTMQQNKAVMGLLKSVHQTLMKNHLDGCFPEGEKMTKEEKAEMVESISQAMSLLNK